VVRSHYKSKDPKNAPREQIYAAGESIAAWLGLGSWVEVVTMQSPENVEKLRRMIQEKAQEALACR
jgi:hypothetical protein